MPGAGSGPTTRGQQDDDGLYVSRTQPERAGTLRHAVAPRLQVLWSDNSSTDVRASGRTRRPSRPVRRQKLLVSDRMPWHDHQSRATCTPDNKGKVDLQSRPETEVPGAPGTGSRRDHRRLEEKVARPVLLKPTLDTLQSARQPAVAPETARVPSRPRLFPKCGEESWASFDMPENVPGLAGGAWAQAGS